MEMTTHIASSSWKISVETDLELKDANLLLIGHWQGKS